MSILGTLKKYTVATAIVMSLLAADNWLDADPVSGGFFFSEAQATVGRPLTPGSVAGVARRTTRRTIRRTTIYVAALPRGCVRTTVSGVAVWRCGGTYYQSHSGRYVVVNID
jgi:hypothetical protein